MAGRCTVRNSSMRLLHLTPDNEQATERTGLYDTLGGHV